MIRGLLAKLACKLGFHDWYYYIKASQPYMFKKGIVIIDKNEFKLISKQECFRCKKVKL